MKIVKLSIKEYKELWEKHKTAVMIEAPNFGPEMIGMTVINQSGPGTPFKDEYERMKHEWLNPPMPIQIIYHGAETIVYVPKKGE